ncbi:mitochondrial import inner membrane translocase subunit Tim10 B-like [Lytechinus pictus]|uniref:mitochondrial import inner membrane translocase subunit Tim10 B-like n=1 Tax=Lytechinus pictus TaxID=7653 RepID=UPI00240E8390|nr:mitochondrial import inner membrane translocase subunit Tim10 B-like [Lytechinus pictus]
MYNQFTETCFTRCVQNLNYRVLTPMEETCTSKCISKLINVNHREISVYMEINPLNRRLNQMNSEEQGLQPETPDLAQEVEKALGKDTMATSQSEPVSDESPQIAFNSTVTGDVNQGADNMTSVETAKT